MGINIYKIKRNGKRKYAHFDKRLSLLETYKYVSKPENVEKHNFYPFIYYEKEANKYKRGVGIDPKIRPICYAAHIDRCIYQYYSFILNEKYNLRVKELNINDSAIAYRTNLNKSNIYFAKEVFDFIKECKNAIVMVGDFKGFFDNLNHKYLKERLCDLLEQRMLEEDLYAIYKSMTKFSKCYLEDILTFNNLRNTPSEIKKLNTYETVMTLEEFKSFKKGHIIKNTNDYGIPQGSSLSGIFSNIYMMNFDFKMKTLSQQYNGIYRRYSDDFIVIIPSSVNFKVEEIYNKISNIITDTPGIKVEANKTRFYEYATGMIKNITYKLIPTVEDNRMIINYLGFSFDGKNISIREKTRSKYFYRMRRKIDGIEKRQGKTYKGNKINYDKVYEKFTKKGKNSNFISYAYRCKNMFSDEEKINIFLKRHMHKVAMTKKHKKQKYTEKNK